MRRFIRGYGRAIDFLRVRWRLSLVLCASNVVLAGLSFIEPILFGRVVAGITGSGVPNETLLFWVICGAFGIFAGVMTNLGADRLAHRLRLHAMGKAYSHVLTLAPAYHIGKPSGELIKTLVSGSDELFWLWLGLLREHLSTFLVIIAVLPIALWMNFWLGMVLLVLMMVFTTTCAITIWGVQSRQRLAENAQNALAATMGDVLGNASLVRSFGMKESEVMHFSRLTSDVVRHQFPVLNWWAGVSVMSRAASTVATVSVVAIGAWLHAQGRATTADVVSFMGFSSLIIGRLESAVWLVSRLGNILPRLEDFYSLLDTESSVLDAPCAAVLEKGAGAVGFHDVSFRYPGGPLILQNLSFQADPGQTIALVGETGSGKSTAMNLLQRLWDAESGNIMIDGRDIRHVRLDSLRARIGIVSQETCLFNRTILENIKIGKPDATQEEVERACRLAEAHDFIMLQPKGYDTMVGERGTTLSGGQRQRLAIARVILRDPDILILDEATSALDGTTEEKVVKALQRASQGRTTFVIAHRLSTIRQADQILVFDRGGLVESGTFEDLVHRGGVFARLARTQFPSSPVHLTLVQNIAA